LGPFLGSSGCQRITKKKGACRPLTKIHDEGVYYMSNKALNQVNEIRAFTEGMYLGLTCNPGRDPEDFHGLQNSSILFKKVKTVLDNISKEIQLCNK